MLKKKPIFDEKRCESCRICLQACPVSAITLSRPGKHGKYPNLFPEFDPDTCIGCGLCAKSCPMGCIKMEEKP